MAGPLVLRPDACWRDTQAGTSLARLAPFGLCKANCRSFGPWRLSTVMELGTAGWPAAWTAFVCHWLCQCSPSNSVRTTNCRTVGP
ncbi:hypothetical protein Poly24_32920 [Rosistilla carotiformis]|uniref:Uncharacterized protein n=1 Tax=Rosistilla carotiformis TaxID=2528017 RepID=A0A518JVM5_9BACT|nr:hypothetical protein Poly24_32920 [Rosistilla carotiformis]